MIGVVYGLHPELYLEICRLDGGSRGARPQLQAGWGLWGACSQLQAGWGSGGAWPQLQAGWGSGVHGDSSRLDGGMWGCMATAPGWIVALGHMATDS